jgi:hypothetical protein
VGVEPKLPTSNSRRIKTLLLPPSSNWSQFGVRFILRRPHVGRGFRSQFEPGARIERCSLSEFPFGSRLPRDLTSRLPLDNARISNSENYKFGWLQGSRKLLKANKFRLRGAAMFSKFLPFPSGSKSAEQRN